MTTLEKTRQIMEYSLKRKIPVADLLPLPRLLTYGDAEYYVHSDRFKPISKILSEFRSNKSFADVINFAIRNPKGRYICIMAEEDAVSDWAMTCFFRLIDLGLLYTNILPIVVESKPLNIEHKEYIPMFVHKDDPSKVVTPYQRFQCIYAEGWGELEGKLKAAKKIVDQDLLDLWSKNTIEIEARRQEYINQYLKQKDNADKK